MDKAKRQLIALVAKSKVRERKVVAAVRSGVKAAKPAPAPAPAAAPVPIAASAKLPKMPKMPEFERVRKAKPVKPCACGCGTMCKAMWAPGHDARAKGWALRIERGVCKMGDVPANERDGAKHYLGLRQVGAAEANAEAETEASTDAGKATA